MAVKEILLLLGVIVCWGVTPFLEKSALTRNLPLDGLYVRTLAVFILFTLYYAGSNRLARLTSIPGKDLFYFSLAGILAGFLGMIFYFLLLKANPVSKATPLTATYPLITALIAFTVFGEQPTWQRIAGTILIVAGIMLVK